MSDATQVYGLCAGCAKLAERIDALERTVRGEHAPAIDEHDDRLDEVERSHNVLRASVETRLGALEHKTNATHDVVVHVRSQNNEILALLRRDVDG